MNILKEFWIPISSFFVIIVILLILKPLFYVFEFGELILLLVIPFIIVLMPIILLYRVFIKKEVVTLAEWIFFISIPLIIAYLFIGWQS